MLKSQTDLPIYQITEPAEDRAIVKQVADIERLVQPFDGWGEEAIESLLSQDVNKCWIVICEASTQTENKAAIEQGTGQMPNQQAQVVAYCLMSQVFEVAEVLRIGTHLDFQRQGLAKGLLRFFIEQMPEKGLDKILLEVRADNTAGIRLYEKLGFQVIHTRKGYYSNSANDGSSSVTAKCDALIMEYVCSAHQ